MHDRHPTAQVVTMDDQLYLIDCGEGTQVQMNRFRIRRSRINHIFISHLHGDHYFGLFGLLNSLGLTGRTQDLHLYAPAALEKLLDNVLEAADTDLPYKLIFHPIREEGILWDGARMTVSAFAVNHRIECWGFLFREKEKLRKVEADKALQLGIPLDFFPMLKEGHDYLSPQGIHIPNGEVTREPASPRSYAFCADTRYEPSLCRHVEGVNLLYHESTYLKDQEDKAFDRYHSTAAQAAAIAGQAGVKQLLLGHFSSKYEDLDPFREEARKVFSPSDLAIEGTTYLIR